MFVFNNYTGIITKALKQTYFLLISLTKTNFCLIQYFSFVVLENSRAALSPKMHSSCDLLTNTITQR